MNEYPKIHAFIERGDDAELWARFVGDEAYSPLKLALVVLEKREDVSLILLEGDEALPAWITSPSKLTRVPKSDAPDIPVHQRTAPLAAFGADTVNHGLQLMSEYCVHGNPQRALDALASLKSKDEARLLLVVGAHIGFLTEEALDIVMQQAIRRGFNEAAFFAEGPRGAFPILWNCAGFDELIERDLTPSVMFRKIKSVRGNILGPASSQIKRARYSFNLAEPRGVALSAKVAKSIEAKGIDWQALTLSQVIDCADQIHAAERSRLPKDLEIEVCAERPFPAPWLPAPSKGQAPISVEAFAEMLEGVRPEDGVVLTLGGFGDALMHPKIDELITIARPKVARLAIKTFRLDKEGFLRLQSLGVDVINLRLGAWQAPWAEFNAVADGRNFDEVAQVLLDVREMNDDRAFTNPLLVPEVIKSFIGDATILDFFAFCDEHRFHMAVTSMSPYGGAIESTQAITPIAGERKTCLRLEEQLTILCDGSVLACTQMAGGEERIANAIEQSISDIWQGVKLAEMLQKHRAGEPESAHPLCADCKEWCRLS